MNLYLAPVALALTLKLAALFVAHRSSLDTKFLYLQIWALALHNVSEFTLLALGPTMGHASELLRFYFVCTFLLLGASTSCAVSVARARDGDLVKFFEQYIWLGVATGIALTLLTDLIVAGATQLSYTITAVKGPGYWIFQVTSLFAISTIMFALIRESRTTTVERQRIRCNRMLIAYGPLVVSAIGLLVVMSQGYKVNATLILPITSSFFLCYLVYSERAHRLTTIRKFVPGTLENKTMEKLYQVFEKYANGEVDYNSSTGRIEKMMLTYAYIRNDKNMRKTADFLGIGRSTLYSRMDKYGLKEELDNSKEYQA